MGFLRFSHSSRDLQKLVPGGLPHKVGKARHPSGPKVYFRQKNQQGVYLQFRHFSNTGTFELSEFLCERFGYDSTDFSRPRAKQIRQSGDVKDLDSILLLQKNNILCFFFVSCLRPPAVDLNNETRNVILCFTVYVHLNLQNLQNLPDLQNLEA